MKVFLRTEMRIFKYAGILLGLLLALVLVIIGVLSITHDTPVRRVNAEGDKDGPPSVSDMVVSPATIRERLRRAADPSGVDTRWRIST